MNCLINKVVEDFGRKGKSLDAIKKYIWSHYRINIDKVALKKRLELLKIQYSV